MPMKKSFLFLLSLLAMAGCTKNAGIADLGTENGSSAVKVVFPAEGAVKGQMIVKFRPAVADSLAEALAASPTRSEFVSVDELLAAKGVERIKPLFGYDPRFEERHRAFGLHQWYVVTFDETLPLQQMVRSLSEDKRVELLEYAHRPQLRERFPVRPYVATTLSSATTRASMPMNDPLLPEQWHYHNDGQTVGISVAGADINLFDAWEKIQGGEDIIVAVLDQAVQYTHPDLAANMWVNPDPASGNELHGKNFCGYLNGSTALDWSYVEKEGDYESNADHGTHVAGTIAAVNNNGLGVSGIAGGSNGMNGVKIMSCQIFGDPNQQTNSSAADAFRFAADNGALICQCSWGYSYTRGTASEVSAMKSYFENSAERTAIDYFIAMAGSDNPNSPIQGGLVVFAAGNEGDLFGPVPEYPASYEKVVSVASMGSDLLPAYYTCYNEEVDVTAPGGDLSNSDDNTENGGVLSTILCDPNVPRYVDRRGASLTAGCYGYLQGTSMACPHVSGVAALGLAYISQLGFRMSADEFRNVLESSVRPIDPYLTGTKSVPMLNNMVLNLSDYRGRMGSGYVDADLLLENLRTLFGQQVPPEVTKNFSNQLLKKGTPTISLPLSEYFTDDAVKNYTASANDERVVDVKVSEGVLKILPKNVGQAKITVKAEGFEGSIVPQSFIVTVRSQSNTSDGWL